jgi:subtilisin family serine protease
MMSASPTAVLVAALAVALASLMAPLAWGQGPNDPYYASAKSWGQAHDDQWALKRIGFTPPGRGSSAWDIETGTRNPVIVAVIDTGLDFFHPDLRRESIWRNPRETENGVDDDGNGYVDDVFGWNFLDRDNNPWDHAGHGTHVAGVIAAATDNGEGIAGINRGVRIMPLKVLNFVGRGRASGIAEAIYYAVAQGASVINLSLGGQHLSKAEGRAIDYAHGKGVVVVAAAGNEGIDAADYGPAGVRNAITVGASDQSDKRAAFSNWGKVDVLAPGVDILSLRARRTDVVLVSGVKGYKAGANFVGPGAKYYHASGTSFAAPFVTGVASLLIARNPTLTPEQVRRMILQSAKDVETPGWDRLTAYGRLDARAALMADPDRYLYAELHRLAAVREGGQTAIQALGRVAGSHLRDYVLEVGQGEAPAQWKAVGAPRTGAVEGGLLGTIPARELAARGLWTVRVVARDTRGAQRESRQPLNIR